MPRTKTLKQLANDFEISSRTLSRWLKKTFPHWYIPTRSIPEAYPKGTRSQAKRKGNRYPNKRIYYPKEIKLIYEYYGEPKEK